MRIIVLAFLCILLSVNSALAQTTTVVLPWGAWLANYVLPIGGVVAVVMVIVALGYLIQLLPPWARVMVEGKLRDQLVDLATDAINAGVQGVKGAVFDKELTIDVGNAVIAKAAQEAVDTWPKNVVDKLGGVEGVAKWLLTQAENRGVIINADTSTEDILSSFDVQNVVATNP